MMLKRPSFGLVYCVGMTVVMAFSMADAAQQPRAPLGAWFAGYEILTFNDEIVWPLDLWADAHYSSRLYYEPETDFFTRYSSILLGPGGGRALTQEQIDGLDGWVSGGGTLILSAAEARRIFGANVPSWLGAAGWWDKPIEPGTATLLEPGHPLAAGIDAAALAELTGSGGMTKPTSGVSIIGHGNASLLLFNRHGKGHVVTLGGKLCPQGRPVSVEKKTIINMPVAATAVWKNLMSHLSLPRRSEAIARWGEERGKEMAVWWRYEVEKPNGGALYHDPFPASGEELGALSFQASMGERCWKSFFLTNTTAIPRLTVTPTDLAGPGGIRIPASVLTAYVQDKPSPEFPKAPYWLVEPRHVAPLGSPAVDVAANRTTTWWVKLRCVDVPPGDYTAAIEFKDGDRLLARLPLTVKVWPLHQPAADVLHYELEHNWFSLPGGRWISKDAKENDPAMLVKYMEHLGEMGVDFGQGGTDIARHYCRTFVKTKEDGRPWFPLVEKDPALLLSAHPPRIDFSEYDTLHFDHAIRLGLTNYAINFLLPRDVKPEKMDQERWYWKEYATYLKDRGYPRVYAKIMDEIGPEKVDDFVGVAKFIRPAGFDVYTTTPNFMYDPVAVKKADPWLDMWQWASLSIPYAEVMKRKNITFDPANDIWAYTASSYWGNYSDCALSAGWLMAWQRFQGLHTHGYMRWHWNEHEGAIPGPDGPFDSVTVILNGQSVYQGRHLASLHRLIDFARRAGRAADVVADVEKSLEKVIGRDPEALIPLAEQNISGSPYVKKHYGEDVAELSPSLRISPAAYEAAKVRIYELTQRLKAAIGDVPVDLRYADTTLVRNGRPECRILCPESAASGTAFQARIRTLAGVDVPIAQQTDPLKDVLSVVIGTYSGNETIRNVVADAATGEITASYPGPGRYAVKYLPAHGDGFILIVGGDEAGMQKGVELFSQFLTPVNRW